MPRRALTLLTAVALVACLAAIGSGACVQSDTVVSVRVHGNVEGVQQLQVTMTVAEQTRTLLIPEAPRAIVLPTSFTVQMERSLKGRLGVTVEALGEAGTTLARGTSALGAVAVGQTNQVQIDLTPGGVPGSDGGVPDGGVPDGGGPDGNGPDGGSPDDGPAQDLPGSAGGAGGGGGSGATGGRGAGGTGGGGGAGGTAAGTGGASGAGGATTGSGGASGGGTAGTAAGGMGGAGGEGAAGAAGQGGAGGGAGAGD